MEERLKKGKESGWRKDREEERVGLYRGKIVMQEEERLYLEEVYIEGNVQ